MKIENAIMSSVNLSSRSKDVQITLTLENPSDEVLALLMAMAQKPIAGHLEALGAAQGLVAMPAP